MKRTRKRLLSLLLTCAMLLSLLPTAVLAEEPEGSSGSGVTLDISNGSITISATGYKQGDAAETAWGESPHAVTITGTATTANNIEVKGGSPTITLSGLHITRNNSVSSGTPVLTVNADATLVLEGENSIDSSGATTKNGPICHNVIQINKTLTVTGGEDGRLTVKGSYDRHPVNGNGTLIVNSGTLDSTARNNSIAVAVTNVEINGGRINAVGTQHVYSAAFVSTNLTINSGELSAVGRELGIRTKNFTMTDGTLTKVSADSGKPLITINSGGAVSITGGNVNGYYTADIAGRTLSRLFFVDSEGNPLANTPVTVTEGENSWTALTGANGVITTYFAEATTSITVQVDGAESAVPVELDDYHAAMVGSSCDCAAHHGTLAMTTASQSVITLKGQATVSLAASYTKDDACKVPAGFHGDYENKIRYEITQVLRNGESMTVSDYASIAGDTLTVKGDAEQNVYVVSVRAVSGPENDPVYSEPIEITVNTYVSPAVEGEMDIAFGSILITDTGYAQGTINFVNGTGYSVVDSEGSAVAEIPWPDSNSHALTITGQSTSLNGAATNTIVIRGGNPTITLKDVTITKTNSADKNVPSISLISGTSDTSKSTATLVLSGTNALGGGADSPAVLINRYAELTIQGDGSLTATGGSNHSGIGPTRLGSLPYAINPTNNKIDNNYRRDGELIIKSGTVTSVSPGSESALGSSIGNDDRRFGKITVQGGTVIAKSYANDRKGLSATNITISGGHVHMEAVNSSHSTGGIYVHTAFDMSGGTVTMGKNRNAIWGANGASYSITGGNVNGYYTADIAGRTLTKLFFADSEGSPLANTPVTVTEGGNSWTALTGDNGMITTYLADGTTEVNVKVGDAGDAVPLELDDYHAAMLGISCDCAAHHGTLAMTTASQSVITIDDRATVSLAAAYTKDDGCKVPEGFHGDYESVIRFEISQVLRNGQYVTASRYASIEDDTLTVYGDAEEVVYVVSVRAVSGPVGDPVYSEPIEITVNTYVSQADENGFDIASGSVTVTAGTAANEGKTVYTQGEKVLAVDPGTAVTITGTATTANNITVSGGNPIIKLSNLHITRNNSVSSGSPVLAVNADTTIVLEGENSIDSSGATTNNSSIRHNPIVVAQNVTLTIKGGESDKLSVKAGAGYPPMTGKDGTVQMEGGTFEGSGGTPNITNVVIKGGHFSNTRTGNSGFIGLNVTNLTVESGMLSVVGVKTAIQTSTFTMSGGTLVNVSSGNPLITFNNGDIVSITGGNVKSCYTGDIDGRTLTKLYFVEEDGTPVADTEVTVTEGSHTWKALTDANGVITTYFASGTRSVTVSYADKVNQSVTPENAQALIGGECTCSSFSDVTWTPGVPASVTLYGGNNSIYTLADAKLVVDSDCAMPIHPNLAPITYTLSVTKEGDTVSEGVDNYATLENGTLTLKPSNAPYTVTLTAKAGEGADEKTAAYTVSVNAGTAGETAIIDLSTEADNTKTLDSDTTAIVTGNAAAGKVAVTGGAAVLTLNQDSADNVWTVTAAGDETSVTLNAQTVNGKVRFGGADLEAGRLSYVTAGAVKLNPENGDITFNADGSITQGKFTLTGLNGQTVTILGAGKESARTVTNSTDTAMTLSVNGKTVTLAAGESHTVKQAVSAYSASAGGEIWAYVLESDQPLYLYNINHAGSYSPAYAPEDKDEYIEVFGLSAAADLTQEIVQGYELITVGEGTVKHMGGNANRESEELDFRSHMIRVYFDPEIKALSGNFFYSMNALDEVDISHLKRMNGDFYGSGIRKMHIGPELETGATANYMRYLREITVDERNPYYMAHDGVLYSKDGKTLMLCPSWKRGSYQLLDSCESIAGTAFYGSRLSTLTLSAALQQIGTRAFESANSIQSFRVMGGNQTYKAVDGVLYSADGTTLIKYPASKPDQEYVMPEGVTTVVSMGFYQQYTLKKVTLPSTLVSQQGNFMTAVGGVEEMVINSPLSTSTPNTQVLKKVTVYDGYNFAGNNLLNNTSMNWVKGNITVTGGDAVYDGAPHGITVTAAGEGTTVEYSTDGETYTETAPTFTVPGTYTVYWRVTKAADYVPATEDTPASGYDFDRELYSSRTFTITALEVSEDWFTLTTSRKADAPDIDVSPVILSQPVGSPSLADGYTVKYQAIGGETGTAVPTEQGSYLVTVDITADGYVHETLTLGSYTILAADSNDMVLSFVTYGGTLIQPIMGAEGSAIVRPADPTRNGYTFAGWYSDVALRTKVGIFPTNMPAQNTTYYAKWIRDTYTITYNMGDGVTDAVNDNPIEYTAETSTFSLTAPTRVGYTFQGWTYEGQTEPQTEVVIAKGSYGNKAFTAVWQKITYTIQYSNSVDLVEGNPTAYTVDDTAGSAIALAAPAAREGHTFSGWTMKIDGVVSILPATGAEIPQGTIGNIVLTGIWLIDEQTLILNANGGKFSDGSEIMTITAEYASAITLTQPTRSGYSFAGWYTDQTMTTPFEAVNMPLSATLYAKWYAFSDDTPTTNNPNSTTTTTVTDKKTGTVTETVKLADGTTGTVVTDKNGNIIEVKATVSSAAIKAAEKSGAAVTLPVEVPAAKTTEDAPAVQVTMPKTAGSVKVEVPVEKVTPGTVAVFVKADGTEEIVKTSVVTENGVTLKLDGSVTVKVIDNSKSFADTNNHWAEGSIAFVTAREMFNGTSTTTFTPDVSMTRAQLMTVLARFDGVDTTTGDTWYEKGMEWAKANGVSDGSNPNGNITREQLATMLWRYSGSPAAKGSIDHFSDADKVSDYAAQAMAWAVEIGLINGMGDDTLAPQGEATRAQLAAILMRYCENLAE